MCPPKPEALIDAIRKLQSEIKNESLTTRKELIAKHKSKLKIQDDLDILIQEDVNIFKMGI